MMRNQDSIKQACQSKNQWAKSFFKFQGEYNVHPRILYLLKSSVNSKVIFIINQLCKFSKYFPLTRTFFPKKF